MKQYTAMSRSAEAHPTLIDFIEIETNHLPFIPTSRGEDTCCTCGQVFFFLHTVVILTTQCRLLFVISGRARRPKKEMEKSRYLHIAVVFGLRRKPTEAWTHWKEVFPFTLSLFLFISLRREGFLAKQQDVGTEIFLNAEPCRHQLFRTDGLPRNDRWIAPRALPFKI